MKQAAHELFRYFDAKAMDAARFFFGTSEPQVDFFKGDLSFADFLDYYHPEYTFGQEAARSTRTIREGSRNATLSHFAGRVLKRYGDSEQARAAFLEEAAKCVPPLEDGELSTIWRSAQGFYQRISQQDGYIAPDSYNTEGFT